MGSVLEHRVLRGQDDVAQQGQLGVDAGGPVDRPDHPDVDLQEVHEERAPLGCCRSWRDSARPPEVDLADELLPGAGVDDHPVVVVVADVREGPSQLLVKAGSPHDLVPIQVERHLQDPVLPLHPDVAIARGVRLE